MKSLNVNKRPARRSLENHIIIILAVILSRKAARRQGGKG